MTLSIFLHGGGDHEASREAVYGRFLDAGGRGNEGRFALIVVAPTLDEAAADYHAYAAILMSLLTDSDALLPILLAPQTPLTVAHLEEVVPTAVFVCGGKTPLYHQALCQDTSWLNYVRERGLPYGGTSAGAAIAAKTAVLGGWQTTRNDAVIRDILFVGASEGQDLLTTEPGLGLVPFAVDVHASQMGTLTRLIHAIEQGHSAEGWAIDENTMLEITPTTQQVYGRGHAYHLLRQPDGQVCIAIVC
ncbi:MAG: Type 1 glutamine amidotransferase-like domain-containing protein [Chloroflexota bacterium]